MSTTTAESRTVVPTLEDIELAKKVATDIKAFSDAGGKRCLITNHKEKIELSENVFQLLVTVLHSMARGKGIMLVPVDAELSTQEAADMLNVSRPYLVKLLDEGKIAYRNVGRYRRVRYEDMVKYQKQLDERREAAMDRLVAQAHDLAMGY